jgi:NADH-quinone oxidoreductase subunit L
VLFLIPLLPFAGFLLNASFGRRLSKPVSAAVACLAMAASLAVSIASVVALTRLEAAGRVVDQSLYTWMASGDSGVAGVQARPCRR